MLSVCIMQLLLVFVRPVFETARVPGRDGRLRSGAGARWEHAERTYSPAPRRITYIFHERLSILARHKLSF